MESTNSILKFDRNRKIAKTCPCGRNNRDGKFAPFKGYNDKGYCHSCGETFFPKNEENSVRSFFSPKESEQTKTISYLPFDLMERSVLAHERCNLFPFLEKLFTSLIASWLCKNYLVGSNKSGNTVFWQVDTISRVRQGKVIKYENGKRSKSIDPKFIGKEILDDDHAVLKQCFFGQHLLKDDRPVAITEGEKTAIVASVYHPSFTWIATGGKHGVSLTEKETTKALSGKRVILFPDANAYAVWSEKAKVLQAVAGCKVVVSDVIEKYATDAEKEAGLDIVDYLLRKTDETGLALTDHAYPVIWDYRF